MAKKVDWAHRAVTAAALASSNLGLEIAVNEPDRLRDCARMFRPPQDRATAMHQAKEMAVQLCAPIIESDEIQDAVEAEAKMWMMDELPKTEVPAMYKLWPDIMAAVDLALEP
jgi:hypothetical protein